MELRTFHTIVTDKGEQTCGDIGVSADEWLDLLRKEAAMQYIDTLLCFLREPWHEGSCTVVGSKYGKPSLHYNGKITGFSKWVQRQLNRFRLVSLDGKITYWCIPMEKGWDSPRGFIWLMRKELVQALQMYLMESLIHQFESSKSSASINEMKGEGFYDDELYQIICNYFGIECEDIDKRPKHFTEIINGFAAKYGDKVQEIIQIELPKYDAVQALFLCMKEYMGNMKKETKDKKYTWIPYYKEFAEKLLQFRSNRKELLVMIYNHRKELHVDYLHDKEGKDDLLTDIDPFSIFGIFNRYIEHLNRLNAVRIFKDLLNLKSPIPDDFEGVPILNNQKSYFFGYRDKRNENDIENLWIILEKIINDENIEDAFNKVIRQYNININITMALFWVRPNDFLALDTKNRTYLERYKIILPNIVPEYKKYKRIIDDIHRKMETNEIREKTFYELSANAEKNHLIDTQIDNIQSKYAEYIELLKVAHNLVLTGAPGTGKTYMAQRIAKGMGCAEDEICFVQFHPSYDYTDFVEGLRPIENSDGQIGFERRDGVFKDFCKRAVKNLIDSKKSVESLTNELSWEEKLQQFIEIAIENNTIFNLSVGSEFTIDEFRQRTIIIHNEKNEKTKQIAVNADEIIEMLEWLESLHDNDVQFDNGKDLGDYICRKFPKIPTPAKYYALVIAKAIRKMKTPTPDAPANKVERKPFVFIIDEINRGEVSKIFGELFYAIDPGYRGNNDVRVKTQYQNLVPDTDVFAEGFYVPENVYILATMNDIDRSVESMDFAMRRRFTWKEVLPTDTDDMLDVLDCADKAKATMNRLNEVISTTDGLGSAYQVGPSYFLKLRDNGNDFDKLWKMNIEPLLKEYLRGFRMADEILKKLNRAYFADETAEEN